MGLEGVPAYRKRTVVSIEYGIPCRVTFVSVLFQADKTGGPSLRRTATGGFSATWWCQQYAGQIKTLVDSELNKELNEGRFTEHLLGAAIADRPSPLGAHFLSDSQIPGRSRLLMPTGCLSHACAPSSRSYLWSAAVS